MYLKTQKVDPIIFWKYIIFRPLKRCLSNWCGNQAIYIVTFLLLFISLFIASTQPPDTKNSIKTQTALVIARLAASDPNIKVVSLLCSMLKYVQFVWSWYSASIWLLFLTSSCSRSRFKYFDFGIVAEILFQYLTRYYSISKKDISGGIRTVSGSVLLSEKHFHFANISLTSMILQRNSRLISPVDINSQAMLTQVWRLGNVGKVAVNSWLGDRGQTDTAFVPFSQDEIWICFSFRGASSCLYTTLLFQLCFY